MITEYCIAQEFIDQVEAQAEQRRNEVAAMSIKDKAKRIINICESAGKRDDVKPDVLEMARSILEAST